MQSFPKHNEILLNYQTSVLFSIHNIFSGNDIYIITSCLALLIKTIVIPPHRTNQRPLAIAVLLWKSKFIKNNN